MIDDENTIRYFKLKNKAGFVVRMHLLHWKYTTDQQGNVSFQMTEWEETYEDGYIDICAADSRTMDIADFGLPDGIHVKLKAFVVWGKDKIGEEFTYNNASTSTITYKITGTTLHNTLTKE